MMRTDSEHRQPRYKLCLEEATTQSVAGERQRQHSESRLVVSWWLYSPQFSFSVKWEEYWMDHRSCQAGEVDHVCKIWHLTQCLGHSKRTICFRDSYDTIVAISTEVKIDETNVYSFPTDAWTNCHRLGGFKQHKMILKVWRLKVRVLVGLAPSWGSGGPVPLPLLGLETTCDSWPLISPLQPSDLLLWLSSYVLFPF